MRGAAHWLDAEVFRRNLLFAASGAAICASRRGFPSRKLA
jgi:hypothetical protein